MTDAHLRPSRSTRCCGTAVGSRARAAPDADPNVADDVVQERGSRRCAVRRGTRRRRGGSPSPATRRDSSHRSAMALRVTAPDRRTSRATSAAAFAPRRPRMSPRRRKLAASREFVARRRSRTAARCCCWFVGLAPGVIAEQYSGVASDAHALEARDGGAARHRMDERHHVDRARRSRSPDRRPRVGSAGRGRGSDGNGLEKLAVAATAAPCCFRGRQAAWSVAPMGTRRRAGLASPGPSSEDRADHSAHAAARPVRLRRPRRRGSLPTPRRARREGRRWLMARLHAARPTGTDTLAADCDRRGREPVAGAETRTGIIDPKAPPRRDEAYVRRAATPPSVPRRRGHQRGSSRRVGRALHVGSDLPGLRGSGRARAGVPTATRSTSGSARLGVLTGRVRLADGTPDRRRGGVGQSAGRLRRSRGQDGASASTACLASLSTSRTRRGPDRTSGTRG
jgi:hypothetical protein